jgi:hypothetical protein
MLFLHSFCGDYVFLSLDEVARPRRRPRGQRRLSYYRDLLMSQGEKFYLDEIMENVIYYQ